MTHDLKDPTMVDAEDHFNTLFYPFVYTSVYQSVYLSTYLPFYLQCLSICLSVYLSIYLSVYPPSWPGLPPISEEARASTGVSHPRSVVGPQAHGCQIEAKQACPN